MSIRSLPPKRWFALTALAVLAVMALSSGILFAANAPTPPDVAVAPSPPDPVDGRVFRQTDGMEQQVNLPPITKEPPTYPDLDANLNLLAEASSTARGSADADSHTTDQPAEPVLVTFYVEPRKTTDVHQYLEDNGVFVRNVGEGYVEAHVPPYLLGAASEQPGVLRVDTVIPPWPAQSQGRAISQGVGIHGADAWHSAGYRGNGVKVGIFDVGFERVRSLQGSELPTNLKARCYFAQPRRPSSDLADCAIGGGNHGTNSAETLIDVAPDVDLHIANPYSRGDVRDAIDWMVEHGVEVVSVSLHWPYDGYGDGTSPDRLSPLNTIDRAVAGGIVWVNAAGNAARKNVWYGPASDPDGDGWLHFANDWSGDWEVNPVSGGGAGYIAAVMRWDGDWGRADCDLDLVLMRRDDNEDEGGLKKLTPILADDRLQGGRVGSNPLAWLILYHPEKGKDYALAIGKRTCATPPAWIQLSVNSLNGLRHSSPGHHIGNPGESRSLGMMAVGATNYWETDTIASYSSRGPTVDGRTKPDITGVTCGITTSADIWEREDGNHCWYSGTSAATPHIGGLAALVKDRFPDFTPQQVVQYLQDNAVERGPAGADNTWGAGLAALPSVEPRSTPTAVTASPPTRNIAVGDGVAPGEVVISWDMVPEATYYRIGYVNLVKDYPRAKASATGEWLEAFVYVDVNTLNIPVTGGRGSYTLHRLVQGDRHAFTVLASNDVENTREHFSGRYAWPQNPRWQFHTPLEFVNTP